MANYNSPEQTVIAGARGAVERALVAAKQRGAKRAIPLPVSAPFHCALMRPARAGLTPALAAVNRRLGQTLRFDRSGGAGEWELAMRPGKEAP